MDILTSLAGTDAALKIMVWTFYLPVRNRLKVAYFLMLNNKISAILLFLMTANCSEFSCAMLAPVLCTVFGLLINLLSLMCWQNEREERKQKKKKAKYHGSLKASGFFSLSALVAQSSDRNKSINPVSYTHLTLPTKA